MEHSEKMQSSLAHLFELDDKDVVLKQTDCLSFLRELPDASVQFIVTSPPYNIGKSYEKRTSLERYISEQAAVIGECVRVLKPKGSICWQVGNHVDKINGSTEIYPLDLILYPLFKNHGLYLRNRIIWHFEHGLHCSKRLSGRHETILWFTKTNDYTFNLDPIRVPSKYPHKKYFKGPRKGELSGNPLGKNPGDVWIIPNVKFNHVEKTDHPCQFPVELVERLVLSMSDENDIVLDPYVGVGSSIIAALKHNRKGYGCDISEDYIQTALQRIRELRMGTLRLRPMNKPVYSPPKSDHP